MNRQQLRSSILQEAFTGRLVLQNSSDEPASKLLRRINSKAKLLQTEQPLPQGWCACSVSTIADIFTGDSINKEEKEKKYTGLSAGYNYIATKDVGFDGVIDYDNGIKIPFKTKFKIAHKGSTLLCIEGGSAGRKIGVLTEDVCFGNKLCAFEPKGIDEKYLYYYLQSPTFVSVFKDNKTGMIGGVKRSALAAIEVLVPPLAEQKRIVAKIEELMPLVDEYENAQEEFNNLNAGLKSKLRASLLQEAIAGRLVSQDPKDEPAGELLKCIRAEKARLVKEGKLKKDKNETVIFRGDDKKFYEQKGKIVTCIDDQIPFEIPDSWEWCRMGNIGDWGAGATPYKNEPKYYGGDILWLRTGELNNGVVYDTEIKITEKALKECSLRMNKVGDVLIAMYGATIGKIAIAGKDMTTNQACCACTPLGIYNYYLFYFLMASRADLVGKGEGGAQPNISKEKLVNHLIPIPPIAEQKRIVEKLESMFAVLDNLDEIVA